MKKHLRKVLAAALAVVFVVGLVGVIRNSLESKEGARDYSDAAEVAGMRQPEAPAATPEPEAGPAPEPEEADLYAATLAEIDLAALREGNSEVWGWIDVPDTEISYPVVQGTDNDYYLNHTWKGNWNSMGAIFMDYRSSSDLSDDNTIIYGHRMNNGSMFGLLHQYKEDGYWEEHPYVYLITDDGVRKYEIFSIYEASVSTGATYTVRFSGDETKQDFIDYCLEESAVDTGVVPTVEDSFITLSTCTGHGHTTRWVVQAALDRMFPAQSSE